MGGRAALMVYGGWAGHEPEACTHRFIPTLEAAGLTVTLAESLAIFDEPEFLARQDLIVLCWTRGELTPSQESNFVGAVAAGTGLAGWHGGLCSAFHANREYQFMTGGQFVVHPGGIQDYTVQITRPDDPIVAEVADFPVHSEQYYMHVDPSNDVLATTTFDGAIHGWIVGVTMPVVWKRRHGAGRVFYSSIGHVAADFDNEPAFTIMARGMLWAVRG
jgi:uncharacterized protein